MTSGGLLARLMAADPDACRRLIFADPTVLDIADRELQQQLWAAGPELLW